MNFVPRFIAAAISALPFNFESEPLLLIFDPGQHLMTQHVSQIVWRPWKHLTSGKTPNPSNKKQERVPKINQASLWRAV